MNGEFVLDSLEFIDADLIEEAGRAEPRKRKRWALPIAAAACLCLLLGGGLWLRGRETAAPGVRYCAGIVPAPLSPHQPE